METKVTSFRLPLETMDQLGYVLEVYNEMNRKAAEESGFKSAKLTKGELIAMLIQSEFEKWKELNK